MKPDAYMPFYGGEFFTAVKGLPPVVQLGYLQAIWYYWSHTHCTGLKDDSSFLRGVCEIDSTEWDAACAIIFDNNHFFTIGEDGKWHQKKAFEIYQESLNKYNARVNAGRKGGLAKSRNLVNT